MRLREEGREGWRQTDRQTDRQTVFISKGNFFNNKRTGFQQNCAKILNYYSKTEYLIQ